MSFCQISQENKTKLVIIGLGRYMRGGESCEVLSLIVLLCKANCLLSPPAPASVLSSQFSIANHCKTLLSPRSTAPSSQLDQKKCDECSFLQLTPQGPRLSMLALRWREGKGREYPRDFELAPSSLPDLLYNEITRRFLSETRAHFNVGVSLAEERLYVPNHKSIFAKDPAAYLH